MKRKLVALSSLGVLAVAAGLAYVLAESDSPKYRRADCIVRVDIAYPETLPADQRLASHNFIFDSFSMILSVARHHMPTAGFGFGNYDKSKLYFRFTDRCDDRFRFAEQFVGAFMTHYADVASLEISRDRIEPSVKNSICFKGDHWIDGNEPCD